VRRPSLLAVLTSLLLTSLVGPQVAAADAATRPSGADRPGRGHDTVRFSTFNASLNRTSAGDLVRDLSTPDNAQAANVAETIQRVRPDVLLINEFDFDPRAVDLFRDNYLEQPQGEPGSMSEPVEYPYAYIAPSNTGVPSGFDLNNNGTVGGGDDAFGFGAFEGQFGMVVYSKYPIDTARVRTFQHFLWKDMPGALLPDDPATPEPADWYSPEELEVVRLSSKSHWDLPVRIGPRTVHFLVSHPTPPVFDGPEDRNGRRNFDEIRFWADYVSPGRGRYIYDDEGRRGGLRGGHFVIQGGTNLTHISDPAYDTADFDDRIGIGPGNLRADYVLPSKSLRIAGSGIFWPTTEDPLFRLTGSFPFVPTSDHRQVWVDVRLR
jgi:hypothetical protein